MAVIVIRLHPLKPVTPTNVAIFTSSLVGLKIEVADRSFADPDGSQPAGVLGSASYLPGNTNSTIVQHEMSLGGLPPLIVPAPVATAAIKISAPVDEYLGRDLVLTVTRTTGGATTPLDVRDLNFNVAVDAGPLPAAPVPAPYAALGPVAAYVAVPPAVTALPPGTTFLDVPTDGSPVPFDAVLKAMKAVVALDPGAANPPDLTALTPAQCRHIAREIEFNRILEPLPTPPDGKTLEKLYSGSEEDARRQFEADLITYYAVHTAKSDVLTKYVFGVSAALAAQALSQNTTQVGLTVPVLPGLFPGSLSVPTISVVVSQ
jgi:hypothetical protein